MTKKRRTSAADRAANTSTPDGETPAGDPELAALVRRDAPPDDADPRRPSATPSRGARPARYRARRRRRDRPVPRSRRDGRRVPARPRRRRSLVLRFGVSFVLGFLLTVGVGAGALYAWGQQYEGLVLPGVRVGSTELGGLTREQAAAAIENAYGVARHRARSRSPARTGT